MYLYVHVTRLVFYGVLALAAWYQDIPWWVAAAWLLYDNRIYTIVKVPFTKPKADAKSFNWADYKGPENHV